MNSQARLQAPQQINRGQSACGVVLGPKVAPAKKNTFERLSQKTRPQNKNIQNNFACLGWAVLLWVSLQLYRGPGKDDSSIYGGLPGWVGFPRMGPRRPPPDAKGRQGQCLRSDALQTYEVLST